MAAYEVLLLNTAIPQIQAAQAGDTYVVPRDIAINATAIISANSATDALRITQTGTGDAILVEDSANPDSTPFVVTAAGNVGIGATSPLTKLEIAGSNNNTWSVTASITGTTMDVTAVSSGTLAVDDLVYGQTVQPYTRITALGTGTGGTGTYTVSVSQTSVSDTKVGGATYENTLLRITDTDTGQLAGQPTGGLQFFTSDASSPTAGVGAYVASIAESSTPDTALVFGTRDNGGGGVDANERMRITSAGNVGIGTDAPAAKLSVDGSAIFNDSGADADFRVESDNNTHMLFVDAGNDRVGIGTSSPAVKLDVSSATGSASPTPTEIRIATTSNASDWSTTLPWGRLSFYNADSSGTGPKIHASIDTTSAAASGALSVLSFSTNISSTNDLIERLRFQSNEAVFNDPGNDYDFRVESDTNTHAFFVQGSDGFVGVGTSSPGGVFHTVATAAGAASIGGILQNADNSLNSEVRLLFAPNLSTNWGNRQAYISGVNVVGGGTATELAFGSAANGVAPVERMRIDKDGNVRVGTAALATTATNGFLYIPTCAGTPTGTPTAITGLAPMVIDSTNNKLYIYSGGAWVALN